MRVPIGLRLLFLSLAAGCAQTLSAGDDPCNELDPVLSRSAFVLVTSPIRGGHGGPALEVSGCSNTFEANVVWELRSQAGELLASGHATGGSYGRPRPFRFSASYVVARDQRGSLSVFEPDESNGEGFPPPKMIVPVVLTGSASDQR